LFRGNLSSPKVDTVLEKSWQNRLVTVNTNITLIVMI